MSEDFVTQLRLQLRDAAEREARRGPARRAARTAFVPALAAVALVLVAGAVLLAGAWLRTEPDPADRGTLRIVTQTSLADQGGTMASGFGAVWAADVNGQVLRVDQRTGRVLARTATAPGTFLVTAGAGAVWALAPDARLMRIDPASGRVVARIPLQTRAAFDLLVGPDVVWGYTATELLRIDRTHNVVDRRVNLVRGDLEAQSFATDDRSMYVQGRDGTVARFDIRTGKRLSSTPVGLDGGLFGISGGDMLAVVGDGVAAADASTGQTVWRRPLGLQRFNGGVVAGSDLWVHGSPQGGGRDRLWRLDVRSGRVLSSLTLPEFGVTGMTVVGDRLWLLTPGGRLMIVAGG